MDDSLGSFVLGAVAAGIAGLLASRILFHTAAVVAIEQEHPPALHPWDSPGAYMRAGLRSAICLLILGSTLAVVGLMIWNGVPAVTSWQAWLLVSSAGLFFVTLLTSRHWTLGIAIVVFLLEIVLLWLAWSSSLAT